MIWGARIFVLHLLALAGGFGQCLEPKVENQIVNALRWNAFWFGVPQGNTISENGVLFKSKGRITALISPSGFWIMFVPSALDPGRRILVRRRSGDLDREELEYRHFLAGANPPGEMRERITEECQFALKGIPLAAPESQWSSREDAPYREVAGRFLTEQLRHAQCPCRYWMPYFDASDPLGFALVQDRNKERYFLGFYWDGSTKAFVAVPSPPESPAYRRSNLLTQRLERKILETSRMNGSYPK